MSAPPAKKPKVIKEVKEPKPKETKEAKGKASKKKDSDKDKDKKDKDGDDDKGKKKPGKKPKQGSTKKPVVEEKKVIVPKRPRKWEKRWIQKKLVDGRRLAVLSWVTDEKRMMSDNARLVLGKKHVCNKCNKTFTDASSLRKHAKIHGEKTFICQVPGCGKKFIDNSKLKRHQLVHTGERPYACPYPNCRKRFSLDFNLKSHLRIHTGEKPFTCKVEGCGKRFTQVSNLKAHKKTHMRKRDPNKPPGEDSDSDSDDMMSPTMMGAPMPPPGVPGVVPGGNGVIRQPPPMMLSGIPEQEPTMMPMVSVGLDDSNVDPALSHSYLMQNSLGPPPALPPQAPSYIPSLNLQPWF